MGAVDLVIQVESPPSVASGLQRIGRGRPPRRRGQPRRGLPEVPRRPGRVRGRRRAHARRRDRGAPVPAQPARRARAAGRGDGGDGRLDRRRPRARGPAGGAVRRPARAARSTASLDMLAGRYPSDEFAELRPRLNWDRVEGTLQARPGRAAAGRDVRRHHPRPRAVRRVPRRPRRGPRVGELDEEMVYESRVGRRVRPGRVVVADRGHHARPRAGDAGARGSRQDAVLARRRAGPAGRAGPRAGRVRARAGVD